MYRVRSTDVWYNAPGIVAAYQPVAAPGPLLARQNVSNDARRPGVYMATTAGDAPTWSSTAGWSFDGTNDYLDTGLVGSNAGSWIISYSGAITQDTAILGAYQAGEVDINFYPRYSDGNQYFRQAGSYSRSAPADYVAGVAAATPDTAYFNGVALGAVTGDVTGSTSITILLGAVNGFANNNHTFFSQFVMLAMAIAVRTLSPAEIWQISRQMAYCHLNPDWSAWGRRRRYYYAPSEVAAGLAFSPVGSGVIGSSVVRSVQ